MVAHCVGRSGTRRGGPWVSGVAKLPYAGVNRIRFEGSVSIAGQTGDTYEKGQYASANLLYYPVENVLVGAEFIWGELSVKDGRDNDATRIQITFKYNFSAKL